MFSATINKILSCMGSGIFYQGSLGPGVHGSVLPQDKNFGLFCYNSFHWTKYGNTISNGNAFKNYIISFSSIFEPPPCHQERRKIFIDAMP